MGGAFFSGFACAIFEERPKDNADIVETKRFVGRAALPEGGGVGGGGGGGVEVEQVCGTFDLSSTASLQACDRSQCSERNWIRANPQVVLGKNQINHGVMCRHSPLCCKLVKIVNSVTCNMIYYMS